MRKKIILILDGMADRAQIVLSNKTPLEYADTPNLDSLYKVSEAGCVQTIPDGEEAGSAVANLNLLGFSSKKVYKGRAVLEAAGANIKIDKNNLYIRCNLVSLKGASFNDSVIESYNAFDIETNKALPLIQKLNEQLFEKDFELINTDSFRNILVVKNKTKDYDKLSFMAPHDIISQPINQYLKGNKESNTYYALMEKAYNILAKDNKTHANGIWFWGASVAPNIKKTKDGQKKIILSETTLLKGIANLAEIKCVTVSEDKGFEMFLKDKLTMSLNAISADNDFIYIHIQKPDDLSHELLPKEKSKALEIIDKIFIKGLIEGIKEDYSLIIASDHYTFSDSGGHGREPAPFILIKSDSQNKVNSGNFSERSCVLQNNILTTTKLLKKL